jgi:hypothetical protein
MDYIHTFNDLKIYKNRVRKEKTMRVETDHIYYDSVWSKIRRKLFVVKIKFRLLFSERLFLINDYPYTKLTSKIKHMEHYVLWYKGHKPTFFLKNNQLFCDHGAKKHLLIGNVTDFEDFENYMSLKSVKDVKHIQVFVLKKAS